MSSSDDDAFLRGLLVSMGASDFDASTVECLRQIAVGACAEPDLRHDPEVN